jgi:hypothetical protein
MAKPRRRYSWALSFTRADPEIKNLSRQAHDGWEYARALARNARERSEAGLRGEIVPARLTASQLAGEGMSQFDVQAALKQARVELFGKDLSNSAIAYRLQRGRIPRVCAEPGCQHALSSLAHARRRYCDQHRTGAARARRHRRSNNRQTNRSPTPTRL